MQQQQTENERDEEKTLIQQHLRRVNEEIEALSVGKHCRGMHVWRGVSSRGLSMCGCLPCMFIGVDSIWQ